jgi:hypothetical protein
MPTTNSTDTFVPSDLIQTGTLTHTASKYAWVYDFVVSKMRISETWDDALVQKDVVSMVQNRSVTTGGQLFVSAPGSELVFLQPSFVNSTGVGTYSGQTITGLHRRTQDLEVYANTYTPPLGVRVTAVAEDAPGDTSEGEIVTW